MYLLGARGREICETLLIDGTPEERTVKKS